MKRMKITGRKKLLFVFMQAVMLTGYGQADSLLVLSEPEFINIVRKYHPVAKQANLFVEMARAQLTAARAGFDPLFYMSTERKTFDGKNYYNFTQPELKIPTWYGINLKAGLERNIGDLLNSEVTPGRSSYAGIEVPLAKNLVMDKRRAVLKQAKIFREQSKAGRLNIINDLLFDAYAAYWNWVKEYRIYQLVTDVVRVNEQRLKLVRLSYQQGDKPAIDTTETLAQLQAFQLAQNEAMVKFKTAGFELSNYMWLENDSAWSMPDTVVPDPSWNNVNTSSVNIPALDQVLTLARTNHPKLQVFDFKLQMLEIEKQLKFQNLLPLFNVKYNVLNSGYNVFKDIDRQLLDNNYKFGIDIGIPLRLSQGRGEYRAAKIKIQETGLDLFQTRLVIDNKVKQYFNELVALQAQVSIAEDNYNNYLRLFRGEELRFRAGESSLFLLNTRENKLLEAFQKLVDLKTKFFKTYAGLQWAAGQLR
ncbi:MAG: TolC family protein [Chitinophagaceae bacterium]|nr:TolC family protein [Chitinophagaceae bacterium]